jgi:hypothetical protein
VTVLAVVRTWSDNETVAQRLAILLRFHLVGEERSGWFFGVTDVTDGEQFHGISPLFKVVGWSVTF